NLTTYLPIVSSQVNPQTANSYALDKNKALKFSIIHDFISIRGISLTPLRKTLHQFLCKVTLLLTSL
ncbi:MAG: hypothetical protein ACTSPI_17940, partial [Candidatus Heimdallarchaeaceae archaeon]